MRIPISNHIATNELLVTLKERYSNLYTCKYFEFGLEPSIIVRKSTWVGAQITIRGEEIELDFTFPTLATSITGMIVFYSGIFAIPSLITSWIDLQKDLGGFLIRKYAG